MTPVLPAARSSHRRLRATVAWFAVLAGTAMALQLVVLAVDIGPPSVAVGAVIAAMALVGIWGAVSFWRLVAGGARRPRLAAVLLLVAVAWAALSALTIAWLIAAFNPAVA
jgi:hypothetical protein